MDSNQIYKAPSIPKLSTRNISSSVLRSAAVTTSGPKLKRTTFSFVRPKISPETLKTDISNVQISQSLVETNAILVEIQKQLAYDFAMRIAEEKEAIKKIKTAESKRKFAEKEKSVEETKKIGGALGGVIGKVTAPIQNVFEKIKEFFSLILTGIVLNSAFKWLQDENNRKLLDGVFYWIGKAFVPAVIAIIGYKVFKWIRRLYIVGRFLWKLPGRLGKLFGLRPAAGGSPTTPTTGRNPTKPTLTKPNISPQRSPLLNSQGKPLGGPIKPSGPLVTPSGSPLRQAYPLAGQRPFRAPSIPKGPPPKLKTTRLPQGLGGSGGTRGSAAFTIGSYLYGLTIGPEMMKQKISFLEALKRTNPQEYKKQIEILKQNAQIEAGLSYIGAPSESIPILKALGENYKTLISPLKFSGGGTVPGKGSGLVDSVKAMLAPGEEVIRSAPAMLFRPLLKDINDNAGRLWVTFSQAIRKLLSVSQYQKEVSQEFSKVIEDFNKYLKDDILKKKTSKPPGGGGFRMSSATKQTSISAAPKVANISMNISAGSGGMTFLPMVLPKQSSKPPQIPQMQGKATEVPVISPVNFANYWMDISPELYGIELYG